MSAAFSAHTVLFFSEQQILWFPLALCHNNFFGKIKYLEWIKGLWTNKWWDIFFSISSFTPQNSVKLIYVKHILHTFPQNPTLLHVYICD